MNKIQESNGELQAPRTTAWQADRMKQLYGQDFEPDVTQVESILDQWRIEG